MKRLILCLTVYVLVHSSSGDSIRLYEGQAESTITALLTSEDKTGSFISAKEAKEFLDAHPFVITPDASKIKNKQDLNSKTKTDTERIDAIIKYLDLDK